MSYELYRTSTLGYTLQDTLDDLIASQQITPGAERERTPPPDPRGTRVGGNSEL